MKKKINIIYLLGTFVVGGTQTQILETLRRLDRERFDARVAGFGQDGILREQLDALGIPVTMFDFTGIDGRMHLSSYAQLYRFLSELVRYFRREQPDIVQTFLFWPNIYGSIAAKLAGVPVIITGRRGLSERNMLRWYYRWLLAVSNMLATVVVANAEAVKDHSLSHEYGLRATKIRVLYNGFDCKRYQIKIDTRHKKQALGIAPDVPVIGVVSNLLPCKGLEDVIDAAARVAQTVPKAVWLFIGRDDGLQAQLSERARLAGISEAVRFLSQRSDVPELLAILDILVSASHSEGLPNCVLEGMAAGKAIVATRVGGTAELIENGRSGYIVPKANPVEMAHAVERLLRDRTLREKFGQQARQEAENRFEFARILSQIESFYEEFSGEHA